MNEGRILNNRIEEEILDEDENKRGNDLKQITPEVEQGMDKAQDEIIKNG